MDLSTTISEINSLSVDDRIRLVEAVWDGIALEPTATGNLIRRNVTFRNGQFDLSDASAGGTNVFTQNSFRTKGASPTTPGLGTVV